MTQKHVVQFPIMMYNIGLSKLLISKYIKLKNKYEIVHELPPDEQFVDFIEFNRLSNMGL